MFFVIKEPKTKKNSQVLHSLAKLRSVANIMIFIGLLTWALVPLYVYLDKFDMNLTNTTLLIAVSSYLILGGIKIMSNTAFRILKIMLVINIILGLSMLSGIFPILLIIYSIIALKNIKPYLEWRQGNYKKLRSRITYINSLIYIYQ
jgi:hypothetical protein